VAAIVTALQDPTITCLELTYEQLPEESKRLLESMKHLLDPSENYSQYMATLNGSHLPSIPFLGKYVT
jgi:hypothetical protein